MPPYNALALAQEPVSRSRPEGCMAAGFESITQSDCAAQWGYRG